MQKATKTLAALLLVGAFPASAGELTGTGGPTPVDSYQAASICSFSGLNDDSAPTPDIVQTYGMIVRAFGGAHYPFGPGITCRPA